MAAAATAAVVAGGVVSLRPERDPASAASSGIRRECSLPSSEEYEEAASGAEFDAAVDALHAQFIAALRDLYETHKGTSGFADTALVIR